ncbi:MAG: response regulator [Fulvivirga sp.]
MANNSVFIVDDDPVFRTVFDKLLARHDYKNVMHFTSGEECLSELTKNSNKPSLIFLDFSMQGMNGLDVLQRIKLISKKIKVAIVTSIDSQELRDRCMASGAFSYINKNDLAARISPLVATNKKGIFSSLLDLSRLSMN